MSGVISKKRAARIERRKSKVAAIFGLQQDETAEIVTIEDNYGKLAAKKPRLSDEEYQILRLRLKEQKQALTQLPLFTLADLGLNASLNLAKESRTPLFPADLQSLICYSLVGDQVSYSLNRWCRLQKWSSLTHTVILSVDNVSVNDYEDHVELFPQMQKIFQDGVEVMNPRGEGLTLSQSLAYVPLSNGVKKRAMSVFKGLKTAFKQGFIHDITDVLQKNQVPGEEVDDKEEEGEKTDEKEDQKIDEIIAQEEKRTTYTPCSKLKLLLSASQLVSEHYPIPGFEFYKNFTLTKEAYKPVTETSPMFSIDCEWCICAGGVRGLARVAVVNERLECVYHTFVKPRMPIVDYLTKYSGITEECLRKVIKTETDVRRDLKKLLPADAIIVGQSVNSDLVALKLMHPYIIDTGVIYNLSGFRMWKTKLSVLTETFLKRDIQTSATGHNPIEDSLAAMELVLLKLHEGLEFGDAVLGRGTSWNIPSSDTVLNALSKECKFGNDELTEEDEATFDPNSTLHMKLFTFIQTQNRGATLVTSPSEVVHFAPKLTFLHHRLVNKPEGSALVKPVTIHQVSGGLESAVNKSLEHITDHSFTMVHSSLKAETEEERLNQLTKVDEYVATLFRYVSQNGMLVVVFGGAGDPSKNGSCFVRINRPKGL